MATTPVYDKIDRPYGNSISRSTFNQEIPGVTQNDGERNIKSGKDLNNVWIDTWIKSKNYKPKNVGFFLDAKTGAIDCSSLTVYGKMLVPTTITYKDGSGITQTMNVWTY